MRIVITGRELIELGVWDKAAEMLGISEWAINEGRMDSCEEVSLSREQAEELGVIPRRERLSW